MMRAEADRNVRSRSGRGILFFSLVLLIGLIIALVAVLPQFYIQRIEIEGNRRLSESELISASGIESGKHLLLYVSGSPSEILQLHYGDVEKRLLDRFPYLEAVTVRADFPYKVSIEAEERSEVGFLEGEEDYAVIDSRGIVLDRIPKDAPLNAPVFRGISAAGLEPGERISEESQRALKRTLTVVNAVLRADQGASDRKEMIRHIKAYFPYSANTLYMDMQNLKGEKLTVRINPADNPEGKISWLRNALFQGAFEELEEGVIDLSGEQNLFSPSQTVPPVPKFTAENSSDEIFTGTEESGTAASGSPASSAAGDRSESAESSAEDPGGDAQDETGETSDAGAAAEAGGA